MMFTYLITGLSLAIAALAAIIDIRVGNGGLTFSPNSVTAAEGDSVVFRFYSGTGSHSVALSSFDTPCQPSTGGFYSGIYSGSEDGDITFTINITSTDPAWYYCSVGRHCQSGMVGVINPPANQDIASYASAAQAVLRQTPPSDIGGGVIATGDDFDSSPTPASPRPSAPNTASTTGSSSPSGISSSGDVTSSATTGAGGVSTVPVTTTSSVSGTGTEAAGTTSAPTGTPVGGSGSPSEAATASSTSTSGGRRSEWSVVLGLSVILGGLVALMA